MAIERLQIGPVDVEEEQRLAGGHIVVSHLVPNHVVEDLRQRHGDQLLRRLLSAPFAIILRLTAAEPQHDLHEKRLLRHGRIDGSGGDLMGCLIVIDERVAFVPDRVRTDPHPSGLVGGSLTPDSDATRLLDPVRRRRPDPSSPRPSRVALPWPLGAVTSRRLLLNCSPVHGYLCCIISDPPIRDEEFTIRDPQQQSSRSGLPHFRCQRVCGSWAFLGSWVCFTERKGAFPPSRVARAFLVPFPHRVLDVAVRPRFQASCV